MDEQKVLLEDLSVSQEKALTLLKIKDVIVNDALDPSPEFLASVEKFGILQAILVIPAARPAAKRDGMYVVVDGRRRVLAAEKAGLKEIHALILTGASALDASVLTLEAQEQRSENPIAEYRAIKALIKEGYSKAGIKDALGITADRIDRMLTLDALETEILEGIQDGGIAVSTALKMAKMDKVYRNKLVKIFKTDKRLTGKDVAEVKQKVADKSAQEVFKILEEQGFEQADINYSAEETLVDKASRLMINNPESEHDKGWNAALTAMMTEER